jgi:hypothetical protein
VGSAPAPWTSGSRARWRSPFAPHPSASASTGATDAEGDGAAGERETHSRGRSITFGECETAICTRRFLA